MKKGSWLPVLILTVAAFVFNTSEFVPIGLLSDIAGDLGISESKAGFLISAYAWVVAIVSLPLMMAFSHTEYRKLMIGVVGLFTISHALSATATGYTALMISRMGVACSHAIFWAVTTPLAVKVAPEGRGPLAMSFIMTGTSLAQIMGMPLGRMIGLALGWRLTFLSVGAVAALVLILLFTMFPKVANDTQFAISDLPAILRNRRLLVIYLIIILLVTGHFTGYSYIEPFLLQVAGLPQTTITIVLMLFGIAGVVSSVIFSKGYPAHRKFLSGLAAVGITESLMVMRITSSSLWMIIAMCMFWGICMTMMNLVFQAELMRTEKNATTVAMALYSGLFNLGIGAGALIGGRIVSGPGVEQVGGYGAAIALMGAVAVFFYLYKSVQVKLGKS